MDSYKTSLIAKGYPQGDKVDYHNTYSLVEKMITIRIVLSLTP